MENKFIWKKEFNVNVMDIDRQHYELFCKLTELSSRIQVTDRYEHNIDLTAEQMQVKELCEMCFRTEEFYFNKFGYSKKQNHLDEHAIILKKVEKFINNIDNSDTFLNVTDINEITNLLVEHIKTKDFEFGSFIKTKSQDYFLRASG